MIGIPRNLPLLAGTQNTGIPMHVRQASLRRGNPTGLAALGSATPPPAAPVGRAYGQDQVVRQMAGPPPAAMPGTPMPGGGTVEALQARVAAAPPFQGGGAPRSGATGPGGAQFGVSGSGAGRFDPTAQWAGLWSQGVDINAPGALETVGAMYQNATPGAKARVAKYMAKNRYSMDNPGQLAAALDWHYRDSSRKIQKEHGMGILGPILTMASLIPGPQQPFVQGASMGNTAHGLFGLGR